ncbi:MAG TPA: hypothetical protein VGW34_15405 [Allosphingosinicella sp.]|nr:hypothetical protein [Allosphingosinicella sp.]
MAVINGTSEGESLFGTRFEDEMNGLGGNDVLRGRGGGDQIDGGTGADRMLGRFGDDVYIVDHRDDRVGERFDEGVDTVIATLAFRLGRNVENLELRGRGKFGWGNELDNNLIADNDGGVHGQHNFLDGGAGADFMNGGFGTDTFYVDNVGDRIELYDNIFFPGGIDDGDTVYASISFDLGEDLDPRTGTFQIGYLNDLILTGSDSLNGTGNAADNRLVGNDAANVLRGKQAFDILVGNGGNDDLFGGTGSNRLTGGEGSDAFMIETQFIDELTDFTSADDTIFLSRERFSAINDGQLDAGAFQTGTSAQDADDRIIYDASTGQVRYDPDGTGPQGDAVFLFLPVGTELTAADFSSFG